jgi:hypothetical protein
MDSAETGKYGPGIERRRLLENPSSLIPEPRDEPCILGPNLASAFAFDIDSPQDNGCRRDGDRES